MKELSESGDVWVFSENGDLMLELLGKGRELADKLQVELAAVLLGSNIGKKANELIKYGTDKVYVVDHSLLKNVYVEPYVSALSNLAKQYKPEIILIGSTRRGKELAPRLATKLETGCVSDCTQLNIDEKGRLVMSRIVYGGNAIATEICRVKPQIATVPPKVFEKPESEERKGEVVRVDVELEDPRTETLEIKEIEVAEVKFEEANVIISGGRGFKRKEDFKMLEELAGVLSGQLACVGCSRPLAEDRKWFTDWIGLSGHKVKPSLYVAVGISGVIQHVAGIRDSKVIVAINTNPEASITEVSDYIIIEDLYKAVPALTVALKKLLGAS